MNYNNVKFHTSFGRLDQLPPSERAEIVFAGRSNVGKSTMINKVFNRKRLARTSSTPGKTATINFFELENLFFADLPGYGYAKVSHSEKQKWAALIEGYFAGDRNIALVFLLIDIRHPPTVDDIAMINFLVDSELPFVIILTKKDKLNKTKLAERLANLELELEGLEGVTMIPFSGENGDGTDLIKEVIEDIAAADLAERERQAAEQAEIAQNSPPVNEQVANDPTESEFEE